MKEVEYRRKGKEIPLNANAQVDSEVFGFNLKLKFSNATWSRDRDDYVI